MIGDSVTRFALGALLLAACAPVDEVGFMIRDGVELSPMAAPVCVECEVDCDASLETWNTWLGADLLWRDEGCPVLVVEAELPPEVVGLTTTRYDESGQLTDCLIELQPGEWRPWHLDHELGHCPWALDHDIDSIDLGSIMAEHATYSGSSLTDEDRERILEAIGEP